MFQSNVPKHLSQNKLNHGFIFSVPIVPFQGYHLSFIKWFKTQRNDFSRPIYYGSEQSIGKCRYSGIHGPLDQRFSNLHWFFSGPTPGNGVNSRGLTRCPWIAAVETSMTKIIEKKISTSFVSALITLYQFHLYNPSEKFSAIVQLIEFKKTITGWLTSSIHFYKYFLTAVTLNFRISILAR